MKHKSAQNLGSIEFDISRAELVSRSVSQSPNENNNKFRQVRLYRNYGESTLNVQSLPLII